MKVMVILCCILWCCASCTFDFDEPGVCPYNVRLNYRYAGRPDAGQLSMYVDNIHQFLFDEDGVLKDTRLLKADSLEHWQGELPPGRYTLVAWGNWGYESDVVPAPVSYTHLRAHETRSNLVCRLLLEKIFFNDTATTEIYTRKIVGSVRCV